MAVYDEDNSSATDPAGKSLPEFPPVVIIDNQAIAVIPIPEVEEASDEGTVMSDVEVNSQTLMLKCNSDRNEGSFFNLVTIKYSHAIPSVSI